MDASTVESEYDFTTFIEACATIKKYAMQTNFVIILGKITKNSDNSYRQALFVCERQGKYSRRNDKYTTKHTEYPFAIGINYHKCTKKYIITKLCLEHNHDVCLSTTKFSTVSCKFDNDNLGWIEKLYDNRLRAKDIFSVLNSLSLNKIKLLLKTLHDDDNIVGNIALKDAYNDERDQD
ncbi:43566_t:CDS:2, partial [Gigaspora margarita]